MWKISPLFQLQYRPAKMQEQSEMLCFPTLYKLEDIRKSLVVIMGCNLLDKLDGEWVN